MFFSTQGVLEYKGYRPLTVARLYARDAFWALSAASAKRVEDGRPVVLCNSYPKSGTHLLYQFLTALPTLEPWNHILSAQDLSGMMNSANHVRWKLRTVSGGRVVRAHLPFSPEVLSVIADPPVLRLFIYRDPRDVAVSLMNWIERAPKHHLYPLFHEVYRSREDRLTAVIQGIPLGTPFGCNISRPPLFQDMARWCGWLSDPDTLSVRFEDIVGTRGGGCDRTARKVAECIATHLGFSSEMAGIERALNTLKSPESQTFHRGKIGGWKQYFSDCHKDLLKAYGQKILEDFGYENNTVW